MNQVSIIIPLYKSTLEEFEKIALEQCFNILKQYRIKFIAPKFIENSKIHINNKTRADFVFIDNENFNSIATYNKMMLSTWFYKLFIDYKYILIYQLDCFVFKDDLQFWLDKNYSYIGAPWFNNKPIDDIGSPVFEGVGNGGFSLRKVKDCIKVLESNKKIKKISQCIFNEGDKYNLKKLFNGIIRYLRKESFNNIKFTEWINEDRVFSIAGNRFRNFRIPTPEIALSFSFEKYPTKLFEMNNNELPFGCHAWFKYDLNFYLPIIKSFD